MHLLLTDIADNIKTQRNYSMLELVLTIDSRQIKGKRKMVCIRNFINRVEFIS